MNGYQLRVYPKKKNLKLPYKWNGGSTHLLDKVHRHHLCNNKSDR